MLLVIVIISFLLNFFACAPLKQKGDFLDDNFSVQSSTFEKKSSKSKNSEENKDSDKDSDTDGKKSDTDSDSDSSKEDAGTGDDEFEGNPVEEVGELPPAPYR